MDSADPTDLVSDLAAQRALSRGQASSIPGVRGCKAVWLPLVLELVRLVGEGKATDLDASAELSFDIAGVASRPGGAAPKREPATWREYYGILRGLKLAESSVGGLHLTSTGSKLNSDPTPESFSVILADRVRLFAETLSVVAAEPLTVDEVDDRIQRLYRQSWRTRGNTRTRMDWQEVLGLIESVGDRRWRATEAGRDLLHGRLMVTSEAFSGDHEDAVEISDAPAEIAAILDELRTSAKTHESRSNYNIWVPSPPSNPNKVENLRTIINAAFEKIDREELFAFICEGFSLKRSSVDSMLPFMRASGVLLEVGRGVFEATPAARAWVNSGDDLNFVRILHANMRFVGEMIRAVDGDVTRNAMYSEARLFGLNVDKCRWIASFLLATGLIEEPRYGSLRATPRGIALLAELPLAESPPADSGEAQSGTAESERTVTEQLTSSLRENLDRLSREPHAGGLGSGKALEIAICDLFRGLGFEARIISGSGDTDVIVRWLGADGSKLTAIVEAKARSSGTVTHNDVSDLGIETHKGSHRANYVAIVGPAFNGDTIKNMAGQKNWILLEAERLSAIAEASSTLGLRPCEVGIMFQAPNGLTDLEDLIAARKRELDVMSFLVVKLVEESGESGEAISARDISRDGRRTELLPSVDEVVTAITTFSRLQVEALRQVDEADDPKFSTYVPGDISAAAAQLRALASAIERGAPNVTKA